MAIIVGGATTRRAVAEPAAQAKGEAGLALGLRRGLGLRIL